MRFFFLKKPVTCSPESFPYFFRMSVWYRPYFFPSLLQSNKLLSSFFPFCAVFKRFSLNTKICFQLQVVILLFPVMRIKFSFSVKKLVTCLAEADVDPVVVFFGCEANSFPYPLEFNNFI